MRRVIGVLAVLEVLTAILIQPAAAAKRSTVTNESKTPLRICLTAVGCNTSTMLLKPGQNSRQVLGTRKLRALYVPKGWRTVLTTKGKRVTYRGPVTVRLPDCGCRRTVQMARVASRKLGPSRSGLPWLSGVWSGGRFTPSAIAGYGKWRGRPVDMVTAYSRRDSYRAIASEAWSIQVWKGVPGRLSYALAILPNSGEGSLASIARGDQDWVWRAVAHNLKAAGRGTGGPDRLGGQSVGLALGRDPSQRSAFRAAFRRVAQTMKTTAPDLVIDFGVGCGPGLPGSKVRTAPLTMLYPGDDVVDIIHCDVYDWWATRVRGSDPTPLTRPRYGTGLADIASFARKHGKPMGIGEWGAAPRPTGAAAATIRHSCGPCTGSWWPTQTVVAYECYFDEPARYLRSSLNTGQNPKAAARLPAVGESPGPPSPEAGVDLGGSWVLVRVPDAVGQ